MVISDAVVTDFSSLTFDFTISRKPVFLFAKDMDTYPKIRRLRPEYFKIPYPKNKTEDELFECIRTFDAASFKQYVSQYLDFIKPYDDGHASEKLVERIKNVIANHK